MIHPTELEEGPIKLRKSIIEKEKIFVTMFGREVEDGPLVKIHAMLTNGDMERLKNAINQIEI